MKSLKWKILIFFIFVISSLLIFNVLVLADDISSVNLGNFTPAQPITKDFYLKLADNDVEKIYIFLENDFIDKNSNNIVGANRLILKNNNLEANITKNIIGIEKQDLLFNNGEIIFHFSLKLMPIDFPGNYQSNIIIKINDIKNRIIIKKIEFSINPWSKIRYNKLANLLIDRTEYRDQNISSGFVPFLEVASNTSWNLYAKINDTSIENLEIKVMEQKDLKNINRNGQILKEQPVLLAQGEKTVNEKIYWHSIPFKLSLLDFTKVPAGKIEFPVIFFLK